MTTTPSHPLSIPSDWLDRRLGQTAPGLTRAAITSLETSKSNLLAHEVRFVAPLFFTYFREALTKWATTFQVPSGTILSDVAADLSAGVSIHEESYTPPGGRPLIRVLGARWRLLVSTRTGRDSSEPLALITRLERLSVPTRQDRFPPPAVSFHPIEEEVSAKPAEWLNEYTRCRNEQQSLQREFSTICDRIGDSQRQRREGLGLARKELQSGRVDRTLQDRADAHAQVRRTFSALRVMMDLLRRRSERDTQEFPASVLTPPDVRGDSLPAPSASSRLQLSITVPVPAGVLADDSLIEIHSASRRRPIRARILSVSNDDTSSTLEVDVPNDAIPPGTGVAVQTVSRFGMRSHKQAVDRVFEERVDGYWPDLIRVLCSPEKLKASTPATPDFFFCDSHSESHRLNEKQRRAVEGALGSDHAFCIQGPPGTGKTTVICELLQQLLAKGQRVLVVAPTHVAIDEVLRRIGSRHGVRALRLAWDDSKVAEDVRRYMPSQILQPYLDRSAKVDSERHTQWAGRLSSLRDAVQHVESLLTSRNGCTQATSRLSGCVESASAALSELAKEEAPLNTLIHDLETRLTPAEIMVARLSEQVAATESVLATMQQQAPPMLRWIGFLGFGAIGVQARRGSRLKRQLADARKRLASDRERLSTLRSRLGHLRDTSTAAHDAVTAASAALAQEQQRADAAERLCKSHSFLRDRTLDGDDARLALEECRQQIERLETYSRLSRRFDEIVGDAHREKNDPDALRNELIGLTNLFCCTTTGVAGSPELRDLAFDTLIVDEASRVTDTEFLIGAVRSRRWILVGDEHQLPPYVEQNDEHFIHALSALHRAESKGVALEEAVDDLGGLWEEDEELHRFRRDSVRAYAERLLSSGDWESEYRDAFHRGTEYLERETHDPTRALLHAIRDGLVHSLFERLVQRCPPSMKERLVEQRRMIEPIASIVSTPVYKGDYTTPPADLLALTGVTPLTTQSFPTPITFLDTSLLGVAARDELVRNSFVNRTEAQWVVEACLTMDRELSMTTSQPVTVSILAFYKAQTRLIRNELDRHRFTRLRFSVIDAIDRIQGQESDVVFLSFCRTRGRTVPPTFAQWLQDVRRLNVACTRAHRALVFVGQKELLGRLCANADSMEFYTHLNGLFESRPAVMRIVRQFGTTKT